LQTFLPYANYELSAAVLDYKRLGKQRVEAKQILLALTTPNYGWRHHPATKMWAGYEWALTEYAVAICNEWRRRGYQDSVLEWFEEQRALMQVGPTPWWVGLEPFHQQHRASLLVSVPQHYSRYCWADSWVGYVWPEGRWDHERKANGEN